MRGEGYANIPCDFDILIKNKIPCSWNTMRVGKKYNLFDNSQINNYAIDYFINHPENTNQLIIELVNCSKRMFIDTILDEVADAINGKIEQDSVAWGLEERKLRFCVLMYLKQHVSIERELLDKIAQVYDDFGFPKDMEHFIYYMPSKNFNPLQHTKEECMQRLVQLFEEFLINEKKLLMESE